MCELKQHPKDRRVKAASLFYLNVPSLRFWSYETSFISVTEENLEPSWKRRTFSLGKPFQEPFTVVVAETVATQYVEVDVPPVDGPFFEVEFVTVEIQEVHDTVDCAVTIVIADLVY